MAKSLTHIRSLARNHTDRAIEVLRGIMDQPNAPEAARIAAAGQLLDRGWGKATQTIAGDDDADPITVRTIVTGVPRSGE